MAIKQYIFSKNYPIGSISLKFTKKQPSVFLVRLHLRVILFMKKQKQLLFILVAAFGLLLTSSLTCNNSSFGLTYTAYNPVFMKRSDLEKSVSFEAAQALTHPAKIYYKDQYLFISEAYNGVHIFNNSDPKNPKGIGFIRIPGCLDMAIKSTTLYVDNATDLVAIDLSNPTAPVVSKRIVDAFPEPQPPDELAMRPEYLKENRPAGLILVKWEK